MSPRGCGPADAVREGGGDMAHPEIGRIKWYRRPGRTRLPWRQSVRQPEGERQRRVEPRDVAVTQPPAAPAHPVAPARDGLAAHDLRSAANPIHGGWLHRTPHDGRIHDGRRHLADNHRGARARPRIALSADPRAELSGLTL